MALEKCQEMSGQDRVPFWCLCQNSGLMISEALTYLSKHQKLCDQCGIFWLLILLVNFRVASFRLFSRETRPLSSSALVLLVEDTAPMMIFDVLCWSEFKVSLKDSDAFAQMGEQYSSTGLMTVQ